MRLREGEQVSTLAPVVAGDDAESELEAPTDRATTIETIEPAELDLLTDADDEAGPAPDDD
jgi:hypothetical protein